MTTIEQRLQAIEDRQAGRVDQPSALGFSHRLEDRLKLEVVNKVVLERDTTCGGDVEGETGRSQARERVDDAAAEVRLALGVRVVVANLDVLGSNLRATRERDLAEGVGGGVVGAVWGG